MTPANPIEVLAGESLDVDCSFKDTAGVAIDVSGANITFEVVRLAVLSLVPTSELLFQRRNVAAGGVAGEVVQPIPLAGPETCRVKIIPSNTATRGRYHYRTRVEWPSSVPPVARIWEGEFEIR